MTWAMSHTHSSHLKLWFLSEIQLTWIHAWCWWSPTGIRFINVRNFSSRLHHSSECVDFFVRAAKFTDELLERFYNMEPYYCVKSLLTLLGNSLLALRIPLVVFLDESLGGQNPLEDMRIQCSMPLSAETVMVMKMPSCFLDGLLNFSKEILPANRGGQMDAPLVLTTRLNPTEVDKEVLNVDTSCTIQVRFMRQLLNKYGKIKEFADYVEKRLGTPFALRGYGFTHDTTSIDDGPALSAYKTLETMVDKMNGQLIWTRVTLGRCCTVASSVIRSHFTWLGEPRRFYQTKSSMLNLWPFVWRCLWRKSAFKQNQEKSADRLEEKKKNCAKKISTYSNRRGCSKVYWSRDTWWAYGVDNYTKQNVEWFESVESYSII